MDQLLVELLISFRRMHRTYIIGMVIGFPLWLSLMYCEDKAQEPFRYALLLSQAEDRLVDEIAYRATVDSEIAVVVGISPADQLRAQRALTDAGYGLPQSSFDTPTWRKEIRLHGDALRQACTTAGIPYPTDEQLKVWMNDTFIAQLGIR